MPSSAYTGNNGQGLMDVWHKSAHYKWAAVKWAEKQEEFSASPEYANARAAWKREDKLESQKMADLANFWADPDNYVGPEG